MFPLKIFRGVSKYKKCTHCSSQAELKINVAPYLLVNIDFISDKTLKPFLRKHVEHNRNYKLGEILCNLKIYLHQFQLIVVIAHTNGHYVGYAKRESGLWEVFDDLAKDVIKVGDDERIQPHILVYTVFI